MFTLEISTDTAAFYETEHNGLEVARILRELADTLQLEHSGEGQVNDIYGNNVGNWKLT